MGKKTPIISMENAKFNVYLYRKKHGLSMIIARWVCWLVFVERFTKIIKCYQKWTKKKKNNCNRIFKCQFSFDSIAFDLNGKMFSAHSLCPLELKLENVLVARNELQLIWNSLILWFLRSETLIYYFQTNRIAQPLTKCVGKWKWQLLCLLSGIEA